MTAAGGWKLEAEGKSEKPASLTLFASSFQLPAPSMPLPSRLLSALAPWRQAPAWRVGFSGGLDSSVLLHLLVQLTKTESLPPLSAIHVHHGLQAAADAVYAVEVGGVLVGGTGYHRRIGPGGVEIGYWVAADRQGEGIATRSVHLLAAAALARPDVDRVEIRHDVTNVASRRVCERSGFVLVGKQVRAADDPVPMAPADTGRDLLWRATEATWRP